MWNKSCAVTSILSFQPKIWIKSCQFYKNIKEENLLKIAMAQIAPVWLNKSKTIEKIKSSVSDAGLEDEEKIEREQI